jgi:formyl-CoA transferase
MHHRRETGRGQVVDSALYEAVLQVMEGLVAEYSAAGAVRERSGSILKGIAPSNVYPCKDGEYLIGANQDTVFKRLCAAMGRPELAEDPRYATHHARGERQQELDELIAAWTKTRRVAEVEQLMLEHAVPAGKMYGPADMLGDPHYEARGAIIDAPVPQWPGLKMQNVFPLLSQTPGRVRSPAPQEVGEHNKEVLCGLLGLSEAEFAALGQRGVI